MTWYGWDASDFDWQRGPVDIGAAVRDGISFFTHKATEGTKVIHRNYRLALERARDAGMPVYGAYFVPRTPGNNGHGPITAQVAFFIAYLDSETPWWRTDPRFRILQVDSEHWGYDDVSPADGARACELLGGYGKYVPHYAPAWAYGNGIPGADPLWSSNYGNNPAVHYREAYAGDDSSRWAPYSGRVPAILQYGSKLTIGSQPTCDGNAIKDPSVWAAMTGTGEVDMDPNAQDIVHGIGNAEALKDIWDIVVGGRPGVSGAVSRFQAPNGWESLTNAVKAAAGMSDAQFAELKAAYLAKVPTAADMVDELVRRAKPAV